MQRLAFYGPCFLCASAKVCTFIPPPLLGQDAGLELYSGALSPGWWIGAEACLQQSAEGPLLGFLPSLDLEMTLHGVVRAKVSWDLAKGMVCS